MSQLSPDAQRLLARSKQLDDPSHAERERMRARLDASWQQAAQAQRNASGVSAKWGAKTVIWGVAAVAAFFAAGAWQRTHVRPPSAAAVSARSTQTEGLDNPSQPADSQRASAQAGLSATSAQAQERSLQPPAPRAARREPGSAVVRARSGGLVTSPHVLPLPAAEPNRIAAAPVSARPPSVRSASVSSAPASIDEAHAERRAGYAASTEPAADQPANTRTPAPAPDAIDDEVMLLGAAQDALQSGHPSRALQLVQQHGFRFPTGALLQERLTVHVLSLCALQRTNAARQIYAQLQRQAAQSPVLARVRADCGF